MSNEAVEEPVSGQWDSPGTSPEDPDELMDDEEF